MRRPNHEPTKSLLILRLAQQAREARRRVRHEGRTPCDKNHSGPPQNALGLAPENRTNGRAKGIQTMFAHARSLLQHLGLGVADLLVVAAAVLIALPFLVIAAAPFLPLS